MTKRGKKPRSILERIMEKVDCQNSSGCWIWTGGLKTGGYGEMWIGSRLDESRRKIAVHRATFELFKGEIPNGYLVCHSCDNPSCVNPDHLFVGTQLDNMLDCKSKGRTKKATATHCGKGHPYNKENTIHTKIGRACRACHRASSLRQYYKTKETFLGNTRSIGPQQSSKIKTISK